MMPAFPETPFDLTDKSILITGGTGSFGKAMLKQLLTHHKPRKIILYARGEFAHYEIDASLTDEERTHLSNDTSLNSGRVRIVTAEPLDADAQKRWRTRLAPHLGDGADMDFETDRDLIGGAELIFPHVHLKFSWADQLEQAKELLGGDEDAS